MNAISTYKVFLMQGTGTGTLTYSLLVPIKEFPDLGQAPEMLDKTTLSEPSRTYIPGIQEVESMSFVTNYDKTYFNTLNGLKGAEKHFGVFFGGTDVNGSDATPTGNEGKFTFDGYLDVYVNGGGVNEVVDMTITIAPTTPIAFSTGA